MSSIIGRFLNYLLVPLYTHVFPASGGGYGVVTNLYAYVALILVILTFGMETTFFRFANKDEENPHCVFSTSIFMVSALSALFLALVFGFIDPISEALNYTEHKEYILMLAVVVALDAFQAIPFSYLRYKKKAIKFASLKMFYIFLNVGLNLVYFVWLGKTDVFYVFSLNLVCTGLITFFFIPEFAHEHVAARVYCKENGVPFKIVDFALLRRMFKYSWPILVLGIAGILNQTADKMIFPLVYDGGADAAKEQLGIYGGCVKIAMIMALITQAFRYAYEPIVFAKSKDGDKKEYYSVAMKYFLIFTLLAYLCVVAYMPILEIILGGDYREGLKVVPIVMAAEIMMGVYFNLSFWYKLNDKTRYGAYMSIIGFIINVALIVLLVPMIGSMGAAVASLVAFFTMMIVSYVWGQKYLPIEYDFKSIGLYTLLAAALYGLSRLSEFLLAKYCGINNMWVSMGVNTVLLVVYMVYLIRHDLPLSAIIRRRK